jgi:transposase-like protein
MAKALGPGGGRLPEPPPGRFGPTPVAWLGAGGRRVREGGRIVKVVVVGSGVDAEGRRVIRGLRLRIATEGAAGWTAS